MEYKIRNRRRAEEAGMVFKHCGDGTYILMKNRYGVTDKDYYSEDFVNSLMKINAEIYVEGGIGE